jgi:hypothetical protein
MRLVTNNMLRFTVLHGLGSIVMSFAKIFIILLTMTGAYFALDKVYEFGSEDEKEA